MSDRGLLSIHELTVTFPGPDGPVRALDGLDLDVASGEITALVGESGSGKTVTGLAVLGLLPAEADQSGRMVWNGVELDGGPDHRARLGREIAMIFQDPGATLDPVWTVGEQLRETLRYTGGLSGPAVETRAVALLDEVRLPASIRLRYPHQLSGGQKQRVMLALALAGDPDLLIADEPTTALDVTIQAGVLDTLQAAVRQRGVSLLFITHDLSLASGFADRLAVIRDGCLVEQGPVASVLGSPSHTHTCDLIAALPEGRPPRDDEAIVKGPDALACAGLGVEHERRRTFWSHARETLAAVRDVDLTVGSGEAVALVGESGCGKTSLARAVVGLLTRSAGDVSVAAEARPPGVPTVGAQLIFQDAYASLDPRQSCGDALGEAARAGGQPRIDRAAAMTGVGLDAGTVDRYPHQLSGGQRQRVALARALAVRPRLLVADEPTASLDVLMQSRIVQLLVDLQRKQGWGMLLITHDLPLARIACHRIAVMYNGEIVEVFSATTEPRHPYTLELVAATPVLGVALPPVKTSSISEIPPPETGCAFAPRCSVAQPSCTSKKPQLESAGEGRLIRCPIVLRIDGTH
jgi:peptide/nickel transport system ATP-binding protein